MKQQENWGIVEAREAIRQAAYVLAGSGIFHGWQDVQRALKGRYSVDRLTEIFGSPFCRLDINQRCQRARCGSHLDRERTMYPPAARQRQSQPVATWIPPVVDPELPRGGGLAPRLMSLMADGGEWTALQLARQLGTNRNEVYRALRPVLEAGAVQVTRCASTEHRGRAARVLVLADTAGKRNDCARRTWPQADPVVTAAIDAIARLR